MILNNNLVGKFTTNKNVGNNFQNSTNDLVDVEDLLQQINAEIQDKFKSIPACLRTQNNESVIMHDIQVARQYLTASATANQAQATMQTIINNGNKQGFSPWQHILDTAYHIWPNKFHQFFPNSQLDSFEHACWLLEWYEEAFVTKNKIDDLSRLQAIVQSIKQTNELLDELNKKVEVLETKCDQCEMKIDKIEKDHEEFKKKSEKDTKKIQQLLKKSEKERKAQHKKLFKYVKNNLEKISKRLPPR